MAKKLKTFSIRRDPLPIAGFKNGNQKYDFPFAKLKIGECFYVPCDGVYDANLRARRAIYQEAKRYSLTGKRFVTRLMPGDKSVGVWRIA